MRSPCYLLLVPLSKKIVTTLHGTNSHVLRTRRVSHNRVSQKNILAIYIGRCFEIQRYVMYTNHRGDVLLEV